MTDPRNVHPLAPKPGSPEEGIGHTDNDPVSVNVRSGVELGAMRFVLGFGLLFAILALIVGWFAVQARQWVWAAVFAVIAVAWNPVFPFGFDGLVWSLVQPAAAIVFLVAGAMIKTPRD